MKNILLCTKSEFILEHWRESIINIYSNLIIITSENGLLKSLDEYSDAILVLDCNFFVSSKDYIRSLVESYPKINILFMHDCPSFKVGKELLPLGIKGYANSRLSSIHFLQALTLINDGKVWLYPEFVQKLIEEASITPNVDHNEEIKLLTNKEKQIALLVAKGCSNKIIANTIEVAESTVKVHLRSIFKKLHVNDRLSLALIFK